MEDYFKTATCGNIPFNSVEYNAVVERKQALQEEYDPQAQDIVWNKRNEGIVNNILKVINDNPDSDILVIFGAEHIYWLEKAFRNIENVNLVFPLL